MAGCLAAASLRAGSKEIIKGPPDAVKQLQLFLKNNPNFLEAIKTLDVGKSKVPDKKAIKKGVTNLVKGFRGFVRKPKRILQIDFTCRKTISFRDARLGDNGIAPKSQDLRKEDEQIAEV